MMQEQGEPGTRQAMLSAIGRVRRQWPHLQMVVDVAIWVGAYFSATLLRYDFDLAAVRLGATTVFTMAMAVAALGVGLATGLYGRRWRYGSFEEVAAVVRVAAFLGPLAVLANAAFPSARPVPLGATLMAPVLALAGLTGIRYAARLVFERAHRPTGEGAKRVLVFGAGDAGTALVRSLLSSPTSPYLPVGLLDDDPDRAHLRICGVRVLGARCDLARVARETGADLVVLAMPSADGATIRELVGAAASAGLAVRTLPSVSDIVGGGVNPAGIRAITEEDLLGRRAIETDLETIIGYVRGKRVLVTGAGGSIGSELCRQLHGFSPAQLIMLDRDESALHAVQLSIEGRALLDTRNLVVADIRDRARLDDVFAEHRPHVVFHTAALKHLPLLEMHPEEGIKTNIWGTQNLLEAAEAARIERFVNISTDKAANPTSVLGYTKRVAERLTAAVADRTGRPYVSVRFGNVLGSRGSVLPAFRRQLEAGGPITVTHPDVTRYFMTIPEAVQLVIQAGAIGDPGQVLILDMGQPVKIADLANRLVEASGATVEVVFTGLRPGEKMHEDLVSDHEIGTRDRHPLITQASVEAVPIGVIQRALTGNADSGVLERLVNATLADIPVSARPKARVA